MQSNYSEDKQPIIVRIPPLRFVEPYEYVFETHTKGRWLKRQLLEVLQSQFRAYSKEYYVKAIQEQRIVINNKPTTIDYILKDNDLLIHKTVRVEPPILDLPIKIINETDDLLIVQKPPGVTIHSGGGFHYNTLMGILFYDLKKRGLYLCHRLDKCTSGVIIFGKNKKISMNFHEDNQKFVTKKMYYARVGGDFDDAKYSEVNMPIVCLNYKNGVYSVYEKQKHKQLPQYNKFPIKQSITVFKKLWYDEQTDSSLLQCYPKTGRTHQIRVHLKYTGFSILNDTVYGGRFVGNNILKYCFPKQVYQKFMKQNEQIHKHKLQKVQKTEQNQQKQIENQLSVSKHLLKQQNPKSTIKKKQKLQNGVKEKIVQPIQGQSLQQQQWDYTTRAMEICLHSYKYIFDGVQYTTNRPYWYEKSLDPIYYLQQNITKQQLKQKVVQQPKIETK